MLAFTIVNNLGFIVELCYHIYINRIVGQVAVSGEHQWVFPENYNNCNSAFEVRDFLSEIKFVFFVFLNQMSFFNYSFITFGKVKFLLELRYLDFSLVLFLSALLYILVKNFLKVCHWRLSFLKYLFFLLRRPFL